MKNYTPAFPKDYPSGYSTYPSLSTAFSHPTNKKVQVIDLNRLDSPLVGVLDKPLHVAIYPSLTVPISVIIDLPRLEVWAKTKDLYPNSDPNTPKGGSIDSLTLNVRNARTGEITNSK